MTTIALLWLGRRPCSGGIPDASLSCGRHERPCRAPLLSADGSPTPSASLRGEWAVSEHDWLTRVGWFLTGNWDLIRDVVLAIGAALTVYLLYRRTRATEKQAKTASERNDQQTEADRQRRITESFARAIEQLGSEKLEVRLGAIYALERIARESPLDHWPIMETLTAFVREKQGATPHHPLKMGEFKDYVDSYFEDFPTLAADVSASLTVIGRRHREHDPDHLHLDLSWTNLSFANLRGAHLDRINFTGASLMRASLDGARLCGAQLNGAHLDGAMLVAADLERVTGLTQEQLNTACGDAETKLPDGWTIRFRDDEGRQSSPRTS